MNSIHLITCNYNLIKTPNIPQTFSKQQIKGRLSSSSSQ